MKKAIVTLSFDDGRIDNYRMAKEILLPNNIPATINIATGYIDGRLKMLGKGYNPKPMTMENIRELYNTELIEIAGHGDLHKNEWNDIKVGRRKLLEWLHLPSDSKIGFTSPGSGMTPTFIKENQRILEKSGFLYVRTGPEIRTNRIMRLGARKAARVLHWRKLYKIAYKDTLQNKIMKETVLSIPILKDTSLEEIKELVRLAEKKKWICTLMFHSIVDEQKNKDADIWCYDYTKFERLVLWLKEEKEKNKLDVMTTADVLKNVET